MGFWRILYYYLEWDYPKDIWDEQQRWNKHLLCEEIKKNNVILKPILKKTKIINTITRKNKKHKKRGNI